MWTAIRLENKQRNAKQQNTDTTDIVEITGMAVASE